MKFSSCVYIFYGIIWIIFLKEFDCCRFGPEPNCGFSCRCTGSNQCDSETGACLGQSQCQSVLPDGYGWKAPGCLVGNVAYGKSNVSQSGMYLYYHAGLAVDGNTNAIITNEPGESCAHPLTSDKLSWWWVDLGGLYNIQKIAIVNRQKFDGQNQSLFNERSTDYDIRIGITSNRSQQALCFHQGKRGNAIISKETFICESGDMVGRFVSFARTGGTDPSQAAICEFIVEGHEHIECQHSGCNGTCDSITGCKACVAGKMLPDCMQECPNGYWGVNCANRCGTCKDGVVCDKVTGSCGEQCGGLYIPEMCTSELGETPTTSNDRISQITTDAATVAWQVESEPDLQQYFYYTVRYRKSASLDSDWKETEHLPLTNTSFQYDLSGLEFNTNYTIEIVSHRTINGIDEERQKKTLKFKTLCKEPDKPPTPSSAGTPNIFTITWDSITDFPSGCDSIEVLRLSITCENSTHTTENDTYDVPTTNTSFTYEATDAIACDVMLIVINNQDLSATSAVTSVTTTTKIITTPPIAISSSSSTIGGVTTIQLTGAPQNMALIAGAAAGGGVVFIALIIIIPVVVILRRRKHEPKAKKDEEPSYDEVTTTSQTFNNNLIIEKQNKPKPEQEPSGIQYHNVDDRAMGGEYEVVGNIISENGTVASKASSVDKSLSEPPRPERLPPKPKPQQKPKPQVTPKMEPKFKLEDTETKVLLTRLENYIKKKKEERGAFKKEYDALPTDHKHPCNTGIAKGNVEKNRFKNIVAYDHSRVILDTIDDDPLSDYVNANYLPGHSGDETYIASQGPKPEHVKDFWRMIWLKDINRIVMVTNEVEGNKKKCDRYWPLHVDNKLEHGDITILSLATEVYADFTIRVMKLTKQSESRQVRQFHFTSWHDKRIPDYAFPLLIFRHKIRSYDASARGPMLVHCSAGIGRTGTFIAIDYLMDQARKYDAIDVFSYVNKMRANRVNMIQTLEQYIFVYDTILEAQMVGETAIPCSEMDARYPELIETGEYQNISQLEKEYKELQKFHPEPEGKQFSALSSANSDKNRNKNIYPSDVTRPFLVKHPGEDSDYINAVYIDGYTKNKAFIVTQLPLENTVIDFWRMVTDHNSTTIIVLEPQTVSFIPTKVKSPEQHGNVEVTLLSEKTTKNVKIQDLSVRTPYGTGEPMLVTIYHTLSWTDKDFPKLNEILQLLQLLEKRQRDMHESPCTIQCLNGVSRSGVLISILYAIDRMRVDQEIDIFHSVKSVRINRNQFVESLAQYEYIYKSVQSYRAQFDTYANFD